jgi:hypothetical protein
MALNLIYLHSMIPFCIVLLFCIILVLCCLQRETYTAFAVPETIFAALQSISSDHARLKAQDQEMISLAPDVVTAEILGKLRDQEDTAATNSARVSSTLLQPWSR